MDKIVAIKTLVPSAVFDDTSFLRFEQEARTASNLEHPNIISIFDFGRSVRGHAYLVMEYINGKTLEDIIIDSETESISIDRFLRVFSQACAGMQHAHRKGVIHRDLKPSNLMLYDTEDEIDKVKIVDFGLAKLSQSDSQNLTQSGVVMGSPLYMSPEQGRGDELDPRSDIYSLGCVMYTSLCGHVPLKGNNSMATIYKHISDAPPKISQVAPNIPIPRHLELVVMRTLEKDPALRPQSMDELAYEIDEAIKATNVTKSMPTGKGQLSTGTAAAANRAQATEVMPASSAAANNTKIAIAAVFGVAILAIGTLSYQAMNSDQQGEKVAVPHGSPAPSKMVTKPDPSTSKSESSATKIDPSTPQSDPKSDPSPTKLELAQGATLPKSAGSIPVPTKADLAVKAAPTRPDQSQKQLKKEIRSEKEVAQDLIQQFQKEAGIAFRGGDIDEARIQLEKSLFQEKILYGEVDPHLLPTLSRLLYTVPKGPDGIDKRATYLDAALRCYSKDSKLAQKYVNSFDRAPYVWWPLAQASFDLAKNSRIFEVKSAYFRWAMVFFGFTKEKWNAPKDAEYFKMLAMYAMSAKMTGDFELQDQLIGELRANNQPVPEQLMKPGSLRPAHMRPGQRLQNGVDQFRRRRQQFGGAPGGDQ